MKRPLSRRDFLAAGTAAATALSGLPYIHASPARNEPIRIGVVGTGGRGTGACANALEADEAVELVGMAEIAPERVEQSLAALHDFRDRDGNDVHDRIKVTDDAIFIGPDAFQQLMDMDLDYVILATPPGFRPLHYEHAVQRGLHVFAEKPLATDPTGCRAIAGSARKAREKGLSVVVGLNYRHDLSAMATIEQIHSGALGTITGGSIDRLGGGLWHRGTDPAWTPMEYQCRNWYYHCWLSGDQIVEMLIHQIDLMNWAVGAVPVRAIGQGGRLQRTDPKYGNIYDHMTVSYEYPGGVNVHLMCRQWDGCAGKNENRVIGTLGESDNRTRITGKHSWAYQPTDDKRHNASIYEHMELIQSIRHGDARNDMLDFAIDSTLTAIMGRESAYTGQAITWDDIAASELDLFPDSYSFGPAPARPVPIPGRPRPV